MEREGETSGVTDEREVSSGSSEGLNSRDVRRVYLITYSQANLDIVPTREAFARIILDAFENAVPESNCTVVHYVCSQEGHVQRGCTLSYGRETERPKTLAVCAKLYRLGVWSESEL